MVGPQDSYQKHKNLKAVLSSLPTYTMSCFKLSKSLCKRLQSILTIIWWDDSPEKRKIAWISWKKLTLPKGKGGLGFRDIKEFNDSLLAKLSWRILNRPESLISRVLLGRYCYNSLFLECESKGNMSHGWKGILAGKEVLKKEWAGSSAMAKASKSGKILGSQQHNRRHCMALQQSKTVSDLLTNSRNAWNLPEIRKHLPHYEEIIRQLHPNTLKPPDRMVWLPESSGILLVVKTGRARFEKQRI